MNKDFKSNNTEEYLFLRNEIMLRAGWHLEYTKNAAIMTVSVWTGAFVLMAYSSRTSSSDGVALAIPFILFFPIIMLYPLSLKIYENYSKVCNIVTYLMKFHENPLHANDGTFFRWETAHAALLEDSRVRKSRITKAVDKSNDELVYLSIISLVLFLIFSCLSLRRDYSSLFNEIMHFDVHVNDIVAQEVHGGIAILFLIWGWWLTTRISKYSSYKRFKKMFPETQEFWKRYSQR